jgi:hypothetical protein
MSQSQQKVNGTRYRSTDDHNLHREGLRKQDFEDACGPTAEVKLEWPSGDE